MSTASRAARQLQTRLFSYIAKSSTSTSNPATHTLRFLRAHARRPQSRFQSTKPPSPSSTPNPPPSSNPAARQTRRLDTILARASRWVPSRLHPYLARLRSAPVSHVAAFLLLHEATAILPLFGLAYFFHSMDWVPTAWVFGPWAAWAEEGLRRYMRYFRRKGWFGLSEGEEGKDGEEVLEERLKGDVRREREKEKETEARGGWFGFGRRKEDADGDTDVDGGESRKAAVWHTVKKAVTVDHTEKGYKIGVQIAAAYAITKMLLVPRIALSLWATPWLARGFVAARRSIWGKRS
ncbi:hypothetical protein GGR54DRAFT_81721 [Hypoxylon sp. NC1633]|nr:hypothetical protein GGR54DRAFT_81721 [Hypoxylon sp. NC1633]